MMARRITLLFRPSRRLVAIILIILAVCSVVLLLGQKITRRGVRVDVSAADEIDSVTMELRKTIHLVMCADSDALKGLIVLIQSIKVHNEKNDLFLHIVTTRKDKPLIQETLGCLHHNESLLHISTVSFELSPNLKRYTKSKNESYHSYLAKDTNFARFFIHELFPSLSHVIYIDTDTLVLHDLRELWTEVINNDKLLLAVPRKYSNSHFEFQNIEEHFFKRYKIEYKRSVHDFNAGVVGFNLNKWRSNNIIEEVKYWMEKNYKYSLWGLGTQPIMHLVSYNDWKETDERWNVNASGRRWKRPDGYYLLHWTGKRSKPWNHMKIKPEHNHESAVPIWIKYYDDVCQGSSGEDHRLNCKGC